MREFQYEVIINLMKCSFEDRKQVLVLQILIIRKYQKSFYYELMYIINAVKSGLSNKRLIRCTVIMKKLLNKVGSIHTFFFQLKINESVIKMAMYTKHGSS